MPKSKQQVCAELDAINVSLKTPMSYSEDEPYTDLLEKLKDAEKQLNAAPQPAPKGPGHVALGKGNDEYGRAINKLMDAVFNK